MRVPERITILRPDGLHLIACLVMVLYWGLGSDGVNFTPLRCSPRILAATLPEGEISFAPSVAEPKRPANDSFENAHELAGPQYSFAGETYGATLEVGEPTIEGAHGGASVWLRWTAPAQHYYQATLGFSLHYGEAPVARSPVLGIFEGDSLDDLKLIAGTAQANASGEATLDLNAIKGQTYYFLIDEYSGLGWGYRFTLRELPVNDDFDKAQTLWVYGRSFGAPFGATLEASEPQLEGAEGGSIWYKWLSGTSARDIFGIIGSTGLVSCAVYQGTSLTNLVPVAWTKAPSDTAYVTFQPEKRTNYFMQVRATSRETFQVFVTAPPANDDFANRIAITNQVPTGVSLFGATHEPNEPDHGSGTNAPSVWLTWTPPRIGTYAFRSIQDTVAIYLGDSLASLVRVPAKRYHTSDGWRLLVNAVEGTNYQIALHARPLGVYGVNFSSIISVPCNDAFENSIEVSGISNHVHASSLNAAREDGEPFFAGAGEAIWWSYTAPGTGYVTLKWPDRNMSADPFRLKDGRPTGSVSNLVPAVLVLMTNSLERQFFTMPGETYFIGAGTRGTVKEVDFTLTWSAMPTLDGSWHMPGLHWDTSVKNPWSIQTNEAAFSGQVARAGVASADTPSQISTTVEGPGTLSFFWKLSFSTKRIFVIPTLRLDLNRYLSSQTPVAIVTNRTDWTHQLVRIGPGTNKLIWSFTLQMSDLKDLGDAAWLEKVEFVPDAEGPRLSVSPGPDKSIGLQLLGKPAASYSFHISADLIHWEAWTNSTTSEKGLVELSLPFAMVDERMFIRAELEQ